METSHASHGGHALKRLAAIDIGTNSFHMVIADIKANGKFTVIGRDKEMVRLGDSASDMKLISPAAMDRALITLSRFKRMIDNAGAPVRAVATSAVREAANRGEFVARVRAETGIEVEVVSGFEEARLIYLGVLQALPVYQKQILLVDIGGGSTEFLIGKIGRVLYPNSLKLGAVRLTKRFFGSPVLTDDAITACRVFLRGELNPVQRAVADLGFSTAVGCSGTILNVASVIIAARGEQFSMFEGNVTITRGELLDAVAMILDAETVARRRNIPGLDETRADIIVAGALILEQIFLQLGLESMVTSRYALREGVILDTVHKQAGEQHSIAHLSDIRKASVLHLAEACHFEKKHARKVRDLALELFDQTMALHRLGNPDRELLEAAAYMHDIGYHISHAQHHRHSYYIIRNAEMLGFTDREIEIIANVARYHRKSHPREEHEEYRKLTAREKDTVQRLSSILRVADGLDRGHQSAVTTLHAAITATGVTVHLTPADRQDCALEVWGAVRRKSLFEDLFKRKLDFVVASEGGMEIEN